MTTKELGHTKFRLSPAEEFHLLQLATSSNKLLNAKDAQVVLVLQSLERLGFALKVKAGEWRLTQQGLMRSQLIY